jgi:hypothetical protein
MMHLTNITGLAGVSLAIITITLRLRFLARLQIPAKISLAIALLILILVPIGGLSAAEFVRGVTGDFSVTSLVLLTLFLFLPRPISGGRADMGAETLLYHRANFRPSRPPARGKLLMIIVLSALVLYPFALGIGTFDPYRLGFGNLWFISGLLLIAVFAWFEQYTLIALSIALAVLAWSIGWYESNNLWNYLIDPWVSIYALIALVRKSFSRTYRQKTR